MQSCDKNVNLCEIGDNLPLVFIGGPCAIESLNHAVDMAGRISEICNSLNISWIYKSCYDKDCRSSANSFHGVGLDEGMKILNEVRKEYKIPVVSDFSVPSEAKDIASVCDLIQIPAYLCRQTDLLVSAAKTGCVVNVKKGQFLAPWDMKNVVDKLERSGCENILITDRGTQFGYNNLVADMRSIPIMQKFGYPIVFDATHSAQLPGGNGIDTSGMRDMIPTLARSAAAAGCNGLFMEVHNNVESAKSDASTQWPLEELRTLLISIKAIRESII